MDILKKPKSIIFDWDNTLLDTQAVIEDIVNHVFGTFNKDPNFIEYKKVRHLSAKDSFPTIFGSHSDKALALLKEYSLSERDNHLQKIIPMKGALELLTYLKEKNMSCAILSNKQGDYLRLEVNHMKWDSYFDGIYGSLDFSYDKPHAYPAEQILKKHGWDADATWFIGDSEADWQCAINSGCAAIAVVAAQDKEIPTPHVFKTCTDILNYLKSLD